MADMDWINLAEDRYRWRAVLNAVMNHKMRGISWLANDLLVSQEVLCSMELAIQAPCFAFKW